MGRSRKLTLTDWTTANNALMQYFEGNKSKLSTHVDMSRTTITNFFNQKPIGDSSFRKICFALRLNWQQVSSGEPTSDSLQNQPSDPTPFDEILIEQVRERCRQKILERHSRMRLLSGEEIGVDQLYVDVWLLEKPEHQHFNTPKSLLSNFDIENDRLALGKRIQRNPGFEIANSTSKLVILGKPGSGKTTFLKHLAMDWCKGKFQPKQIAVLIELRRIQDSYRNIWSLAAQELGLDDWQQFAEVQREIDQLKNNPELSIARNKTEKIEDLEKQLESFPLHHFLEQGRLLILMDGLDEVPTDKLRRAVQTQIKQVSQNKYSKENRIILTCRTQIIGKILSGFTSVEVADFSSEQIKQFVRNWFIANGQSEVEASKQWEKIDHAITNQPDLRELVVTPVLLNLMCLILQDTREIPSDRGWLYSKGIKLLLSRWNNEKEIEEWEIGTEAYRQLSIEDKEALLIEIAARKFENPKNFVLFEQNELVKQITQKLQLANIREGTAVLKAIEAQHGLLIERADELWSFSHLTFQEYFTVQWLTQIPSQQLAEKIANRQWQEVIKQLVKSQQPADRLLRLIKQAIDQSIAQEPVLQTFLDWLHQKSGTLQTDYKPAAIRAFYYSLTPNRDRDRAISFTRNLTLELARDFNLNLDLNLTRDLASDRNLSLDLDRSLVRTLARSFVWDLDDLDRAYDLACDLALSTDLISHLRQLKNELPTSNSQKDAQFWWSLHGTQWLERLREVMIEYRNIGHNWQFTKEQQQQLQRYYKANKFLVDLMNIEGAVSEECRAEIEEGLLLPWAELQHRQPHLYGELQA